MSREVSFVGAIQESPLPTTETSYPKDFALLDKQPFVPSTLGVHHTVHTLGERARVRGVPQHGHRAYCVNSFV